jgi:iron(III) transport system ATP-binding protein
MKAASIEFRRVSKLYGDVAAVRDVSFAITARTLVTVLGPSGCGKTTILRMIAGLELPSSGTIFIGETDVTRVPAAERDVSMVFQSYALFPHMTVAANVGYGLAVSGAPKGRIREKVDAALATVGLTGLGERLPSELSGGQQQRVAVARALVLEPWTRRSSRRKVRRASSTPSRRTPSSRASWARRTASAARSCGATRRRATWRSDRS